jgi:hypothetical protein
MFLQSSALIGIAGEAWPALPDPVLEPLLMLPLLELPLLVPPVLDGLLELAPGVVELPPLVAPGDEVPPLLEPAPLELEPPPEDDCAMVIAGTATSRRARTRTTTRCT